jgi:hypothetical protein
VLYEIKEIDTFDTPMIDILNLLERLHILDRTSWENLRETRNLLAHEYPLSVEERIENIELVLERYGVLKEIYGALVDAAQSI